MQAIKRKPTTLYIHPKLLQAAKMKAALTGQSLSDIANECLARRLSEDESDLRVFTDRVKEPSRDYESVLKDLKADGLL